ncbi:MAG: hypothetical protein JWN12_600 [Candidatus Saccharibacteria bacterium]|nr:hypothetical protein [Candidatus Saccharibacteria bacterium]
MNIQELREYRLTQQGIVRSGKRTPLEVIESLGAMQGQDYHGSIWAIGLRTGLTQAEIIKAIENYEVIRTWPQRGTLHFVPPLDARWMVGISADRLIKGAAQRRVSLKLDDSHFVKAEKTVKSILTNGKLVSRPVLIAALEHVGVATADGRAYHIIWDLSQRGILFVGAMDGKQPTYGLIEETFRNNTVISREEGIILLTKRYFLSHGPATLQDFAWWSGLTMKDVRFGLSENETLLQRVLIEGRDYWFDKSAKISASSIQIAYLLPGFDEYFLGYKDRSAIIDANNVQKVVPGNNGMFKPTIVINGVIVGTWQRTIKKDKVIITLSPFEKLSVKQRKLINIPAKQYSDFLELPVELEVL